MLVFNPVKIFTDFFNGLIPGNRLPAAFSAVADSFQWRLQAVRMREPLMGYRALDTDITLV